MGVWESVTKVPSHMQSFAGLAFSQPFHDNPKIFFISATQSAFAERWLETQLPFLLEASVDPLMVSVV